MATPRKKVKKVETEDNSAYSEAVSSGTYVRSTGLDGKYDNVRLYWEDESTRFSLRPYLASVVERNIAQLRRCRILDLGCGSGDGLEMFLQMRRRQPGVAQDEARLLLPDYLGKYVGIDFNEPLLKQARGRWRDHPKAEFRTGDIAGGLPLRDGERPFDVYFTSYGTMSHLGEDDTVGLLCDIMEHAEDGAIVVGDWLGRYSYEWQTLWNESLDEEQWMDYVISYIYPPHRRPHPSKLSRLKLRLLSREEVERIVKRVEQKTGSQLKICELFDRSLLCGRHMDTGDYNPYAKPLRKVINSLHEDNQRTVLEELMFNFQPRKGFDRISEFFEQLQASWNSLVRYTMDLLHCYDEDRETLIDPPDIPKTYPEPLRRALEDMRRVIEGSAWFRMGDPRANVIEPQLGYGLRNIELNFQRGLGAGHGLVGVFEVNKR